ncbi:TPA: NUMOD1 domain-containing DNA-binding protein [Clostridioides difficile]|nr:hypothetical protein [Clostridioides difficile]MBY2026532.1 hypothetical protein [Clostridioides difficile]
MAKVWIDAGESLNKIYDLEDMFVDNLVQNMKVRVDAVENNTSCKSIKIKNIKTGEVKIFKSRKEASMYLNTNQSYIAFLLKHDRIYKKIWKLEDVKGVN